MRLVVDAEIDAAAGMLAGIRGHLDNPRPLLELMGDEIREYEEDVFRTGGFGQWAALEPDTAKRKQAGRILVDTGGLLWSLTSYPARDAVQKITGDTITVASTDVAAIMHQRGAHGMPKRNPAPAPSHRRIARWAQRLLQALVEDEGR